MKKLALFLIALASSLCMSLSTAATADKVTYVYTDPAGSPLVLTDATGTVTSQYRYEPCGEQAVINIGSTTASAIGFAGKRLDPASDLQYSIARHYDRRVGRFVSLDPVDPIEGDPHTFNRYAYANNNPYLYVDPDGNIPLLIPVAIFIAKEVAAELASEATGGLSDYVSVRRMATKAARYAVKQGAKHVAKSGATETAWRNGWRTADGKFASPSGPGRAGADAENAVWDAVESKPGWSVTRGQVAVRDASGQLRYYDGAATSPSGRVIGLEVKSGTATRSPAQRTFDTNLNSSPANSAIGVGQSAGIVVRRSVVIRVP